MNIKLIYRGASIGGGGGGEGGKNGAIFPLETLMGGIIVKNHAKKF